MASTVNDLSELRTFIEEAIAKVDSDLDTSSGSPIDQEVITPVIQRLSPDPFDTDLVEFCRTRLELEYPDLIIQDGEPIDDYVVKAMTILLEPYRRQIERISQNQSLANPENLTESEAENLGANHFVNRQLGNFSVGVARIYFTAPQAQLITPSNPVFTGEGLRFFPVENQSVAADVMQLQREDGLYYFDIATRAEFKGASYNIEPDSLVGIDGIPAAVKVTNKGSFDDGLEEETVEEYLSRVEESLSERSLTTSRGITARFRDVFENVRSVQVIGHGDVEMERDIVTGTGEDVTYAFFLGNSPSGGDADKIILDGSSINDGDPAHDHFNDVGVEVGDLIDYFNMTAQTITTYTVVVITDDTTLQVTPVPPTLIAGSQFSLKRTSAIIKLSDIPGGILEPETVQGEITIPGNEVHIGGMVDVNIRAGFPQGQNTALDSIRDAEPLHFGVDLESFGERDSRLVNLTGKTLGAVVHVADAIDAVFIRLAIGDEVPWYPTEDDIGRYIQFMGAANNSTHEITEVHSQEKKFSQDVIRVAVSLVNEETGLTLGSLADTATSGDYFKIREEISVKYLVRDRDGSRSSPHAGIDFDNLGAEIGDSVIVELGDDAGIYTIRDIISTIQGKDTFVLDRELTKTVLPRGDGNGTGLRYRIADELDVDLVSPKTTKVPLGNIFLGGDLDTVAGSSVVSASDTNFVSAGVVAGDILEITGGEAEGEYAVQDVSGTSLEVTPAPPSSTFDNTYTVYTPFTGIDRPLVRVSSVSLLSSNGNPQGAAFNVPYGDSVDARVLGTLSNRAEGLTVESYSGETIDSVTFRDLSAEVDFQALGVLPGYRLTVIEAGNAGEYTVDEVVDENNLKVSPASDGGLEFNTVRTNVHYTIGVASAGILRIYFQEPTSVDIDTGLSGGRLRFTEGDVTKDFQFSEVTGRLILPAPASEDEIPRDLRVCRIEDIGGSEYHSYLELTDAATPDVSNLELQLGDVFEVNETIPWEDSGGIDPDFFVSPSGLQTVAGSDLVSVAPNSDIDFNQMDDAGAGALLGQLLYINDGPDAGQYVIEAVVDSKTLRLDLPMTATTEAVLGSDSSTPEDGALTVSGSDVFLEDTTDYPGSNALVGDYITVFEIIQEQFDHIAGTWQISGIESVTKVKLDGLDSATAVTPGATFRWYRTRANDNPLRTFSIYAATVTKAQVVEVSPTEDQKRPSDPLTSGEGNTSDSGGVVKRLTDFTADFLAVTAVETGDIVEVMDGSAPLGVYHIETVDTNYVEVYAEFPFPSATSVSYRIWGGPHGSRRMVKVGPYEGSTGRIDVGDQQPYSIRRPGLYRLSSTEMDEQFDGALYYADIGIESNGAGDDKNLSENSLLLVISGMRVDGYTYSVENNVLTFSAFEEVSLRFDRRFLPVGNSDLPENRTEIAGRNLQVNYDNSPTTRLVNSFLRSESERPICANPMARHMLPSFVYLTLTYEGGSSPSVVGPEVEDYINNLGPTDELEVSDVEAFLTRRGATSIRHPILLVAVTHDLDRNLIAERDEDRIGGTSVPYNGTARTSSFFAKVGEGLTLDRES